MIEEIWKDIVGYEGYYQASNQGGIRSVDRTLPDGRKRKGIVLSQAIDSDGYCVVRLSKNGKAPMYKVHRIIAKTFINNDNNYEQINHKDENKKNNKVENLEWCTNTYNLNYGTRKMRSAISRSGSKSCLSKLTEQEVKEIRLRYKKRSKEANSLILAKEYNVADKEIRRIVKRERWKWLE